MPLDVHKEEYIKSDYGLVYMGTNLNVIKQPWLFGQVCDNKRYALWIVLYCNCRATSTYVFP